MFFPFLKKTENAFKIKIYSDFGPRSGGMHKGIDYAPMINKQGDIPIIASTDGYLLQKKDKYGGLYSYIVGLDGYRYLTVHHKKFLRPDGLVKAGEKIALMGSTGNSTGIHVHFEVRANASASSYINPHTLNFKYFDMNDKLEEALRWNDDIKAKGLTLEQIDFKSVNYVPSKLLNVVDNKEREELLIRLKDLTDWLQNTQSLKNTKELDLILKRYAYYAQSSQAV